MNLNKSKIDVWITSDKNILIIDSNANLNIPTGRMYDKTLNTYSNVNNTRVVLIKDSSFPEGYRILTGFPIE